MSRRDNFGKGKGLIPQLEQTVANSLYELRLGWARISFDNLLTGEEKDLDRTERLLAEIGAGLDALDPTGLRGVAEMAAELKRRKAVATCLQLFDAIVHPSDVTFLRQAYARLQSEMRRHHLDFSIFGKMQGIATDQIRQSLESLIATNDLVTACAHLAALRSGAFEGASFGDIMALEALERGESQQWLTAGLQSEVAQILADIRDEYAARIEHRFTVGSEIISTELRHYGETYIIVAFDGHRMGGEPRYVVTRAGTATPMPMLQSVIRHAPGAQVHHASAWTGIDDAVMVKNPPVPDSAPNSV